jgi:hypothetical protein
LPNPSKPNVIIETIHKVRENTGPEPPEFGPKPSEIQEKNLPKSTLAFFRGEGRGETQKCTIFVPN